MSLFQQNDTSARGENSHEMLVTHARVSGAARTAMRDAAASTTTDALRLYIRYISRVRCITPAASAEMRPKYDGGNFFLSILLRGGLLISAGLGMMDERSVEVMPIWREQVRWFGGMEEISVVKMSGIGFKKRSGEGIENSVGELLLIIREKLLIH